jgi:hypothetical protein
MTSKLLLAAAIAALSIGAAQAAPANSGSLTLEPSGIAAQEAKVKFYFGFGSPYYYQPYYYGSPYYYQPYPQYQGPYQYCHLGVCY